MKVTFVRTFSSFHLAILLVPFCTGLFACHSVWAQTLERTQSETSATKDLVDERVSHKSSTPDQTGEMEDGSTYAVKGNMSFQRGDYQDAVEYYEKAIARGIKNGHSYYNLANAQYRTNRLGASIANYRRAHALLPRDPDILANLDLARRRTLDKIQSDDYSLEKNVSKLLLPRSLFTRYQLSVFFILAYITFWTCFIIAPAWGKPFLRTIHLGSLIITVLLAVFLFGTKPGRDGNPEFAFTKGSRQIRPAVVTSTEVNVYSADSENYQVVFVLHDGAEIEVGELRGDWVEILLPKNRKGWVKRDTIEII